MTHAMFAIPRLEQIEWVPEQFLQPIADGTAHCEGAFVDDECIAIEGIRPAHGETGEAWMLFRDPIENYPGVVMDFKERFAHMCRNYHRVQAAVDLYKPKAVRFTQWLGMRPEGILAEAGPNKETYVVFVTIKGVDR